jgi:hypothetical protein
MSLTNGMFNSSLIAARIKGLHSASSEIVAGSPYSQTYILGSANPQQGVTVYNVSGNLVRATMVYVAGTVFNGPPPTQAFLIPAGGVFSVDLSDDDTGDYAAIAALQFEVVSQPAGPAFQETSTLPAAPGSAVQPGYLYVNFASD